MSLLQRQGHVRSFWHTFPHSSKLKVDSPEVTITTLKLYGDARTGTTISIVFSPRRLGNGCAGECSTVALCHKGVSSPLVCSIMARTIALETTDIYATFSLRQYERSFWPFQYPVSYYPFATRLLVYSDCPGG